MSVSRQALVVGVLDDSPTVGGPNKGRQNGDELRAGVADAQDTSQQIRQAEPLKSVLAPADAPGALEVDDNDIGRAVGMDEAAGSISGAHTGPIVSPGGRRRGIGPFISGSGSANLASEKRAVRGTYCVQPHVTTARA